MEKEKRSSSSVKRKIYKFLAPEENCTGAEAFFNYFLVILITLNVLAVILETEETLYLRYRIFFLGFEIFSVIIFTIEFILRLWSADINPEFRGAVKGRVKYFFSVGGIIDFLAILPFYLPFVVGVDLRFIRVLRLLRFFRFLKLGRYTRASKIIHHVLYSKREELLVAVLISIFLIIVASSLMYFVENGAQPDKFSSIPETMWWAVATLTTVGYGDVVPITSLGRLLGGIISIIGIGMVALPAGILASGFSDEFTKLKEKNHHHE